MSRPYPTTKGHALTTRLRHGLIALTAVAMFSPAAAQSGDDFGIWTDISAEKKLNKQLSVEGGVGFRAENDLASFTRWDVSLGLGYKPIKGLKFSAGYVYMYDRSLQEVKERYNSRGEINGYNVDHGYWRSKHRGWFDVTGKVGFGRFSVSLRERYQYTHTMATETMRDKYRNPKQPGYTGETYPMGGMEFMTFSQEMDQKGHKNAHYLRSRLLVSYNVRGVPLEPFVSYELSNSLTDGFSLDKRRFSVGADYKIKKKYKISLAYLYQNGADDDSADDIHVIDLGFKVEF